MFKQKFRQMGEMLGSSLETLARFVLPLRRLGFPGADGDDSGELDAGCMTEIVFLEEDVEGTIGDERAVDEFVRPHHVGQKVRRSGTAHRSTYKKARREGKPAGSGRVSEFDIVETFVLRETRIRIVLEDVKTVRLSGDVQSGYGETFGEGVEGEAGEEKEDEQAR